MASTRKKKDAAVSARGRAGRRKGAANRKGAGRRKGAANRKSNGASNAGQRASNGKGRSLPVLATERQQVPCLTCALCGTYIAVQIDAPDTAKEASEVLWYLYHDRVTVYYDPDEGDEGWHVQFETRCQHLAADNRCQIYDQRPTLCRDYDETECEVNNESEGLTFANAGEFLDHLKSERPRIHAGVVKKYLPPEFTLNGKLLVNKAVPPYKRQFRKLRLMGTQG